MKIGVGTFVQLLGWLGTAKAEANSALKWDSDFSHYFLIYFHLHSGVNVF